MHPAASSLRKESLTTQKESKPLHYVLFRIDLQHYALPLDCVARVLRMAALTPVPEMPEWVLGMINIAGQSLPVIDLRHLFGRKSKEPELEDRLLILNIDDQTVAIVVDEVLNIFECVSEQIEPPPPALASARALVATIRHENALVMVLDALRLLPQKPGVNTEEGTP